MLGELTGALTRMAAANDGISGVPPALMPEGDGWTPAVTLPREPYTLLGTLIDETAAKWGAPRHVAAALLWKSYSYWHVMPMMLGWTLNRRVPVMRFADTFVKADGDAGIAIAASQYTVYVLPGDEVPGAVVTDDMGAVIREALLDSHQPLIKALNSAARAGERSMWGSTAEAFASYGPYEQTAALLGAIGAPVSGLLEAEGDGYRRRTCCLWVTLPGEAACATCCVLKPGRADAVRPRS